MKNFVQKALGVVATLAICLISTQFTSASSVATCVGGDVGLLAPTSGSYIAGSSYGILFGRNSCTETVTIQRAKVPAGTTTCTGVNTRYTGGLSSAGIVANPGTGVTRNTTQASGDGLYCIMMTTASNGTGYSDPFNVLNAYPTVSNYTIATNNVINAAEYANILLGLTTETGNRIVLTLSDNTNPFLGNKIQWSGVTATSNFLSGFAGGAASPSALKLTGNFLATVQIISPAGIATGTIQFSGVIDAVLPTATVVYSTTGATSGNVTATLTGFSEAITGVTTYTFTGNGNYVFQIVDAAGNTGYITGTVTRIDNSVAANISYSTTGSTTGSVVATILGSGESITILNNSGSNTYTFTSNGTFTFQFRDALGNTGSLTATVTRISTGSTSGTPGSNGGTPSSNGGNPGTSGSNTTGGTSGNNNVAGGTSGQCLLNPVRSGTVTQGTQITDPEFLLALQFLRTYDLTKFENGDTYMPLENLTREQAAKMISNFAVNTMCKVPDTTRNCTFTDTANADVSLKPYITTICQLGIMQGSNGKFRPFDRMSKAEVLTVLVRLLYGNMSEAVTPRYKNYYDKAFQVGLTVESVMSRVERNVSRYEMALLLYRTFLK